MATPPTTVSFDPDRPDFEPYGLTCVHWRPSPMRRPDHHNEIELNFLESGTVTYLLGGKKVFVEAGRLSVFWAAIPHQIINFGKEPTYFVATIPLPWFLQWRLPEHFVQPLLQGELISETVTDRASFDAQLFSGWEDDLLSKNTELERSVLLEMQARLVRLAANAPKRPGSASKYKRTKTLTATGLNKVERMACYIAQNYAEPLTVQRIADVVKLHPNYAMNLFQKTFGSTLIDYITKHRVSHAQRLLATTDEKIVDVAFQSGFTSISRFNEAFRRVCGCPPREYRKAHLPDENAAAGSDRHSES
jgi:AraC-like DNA-binding protein/mannose-6-phosphate isomerase-like protein (cupin superfamily)